MQLYYNKIRIDLPIGRQTKTPTHYTRIETTKSFIMSDLAFYVKRIDSSGKF